MSQERRESFAKEMQSNRKASGKSRGDVALIVGVSAARIAYLERGFANWSPGMIRKYNEAVNAETPISNPKTVSAVQDDSGRALSGGTNRA